MNGDSETSRSVSAPSRQRPPLAPISDIEALHAAFETQAFEAGDSPLVSNVQAENLQLQRELFESKAALEAASNEHGAALIALEIQMTALREENDEKTNLIHKLQDELCSQPDKSEASDTEGVVLGSPPMNTPMKQQGVAMLGLHDDLDEVISTQSAV